MSVAVYGGTAIPSSEEEEETCVSALTLQDPAYWIESNASITPAPQWNLVTSNSRYYFNSTYISSMVANTGTPLPNCTAITLNWKITTAPTNPINMVVYTDEFGETDIGNTLNSEGAIVLSYATTVATIQVYDGLGGNYLGAGDGTVAIWFS